MFPVLDQRQYLKIKEAGLLIHKHANCMIFGSFNASFERRMVSPGLIGLGGSIALFEWARQSVQGKVFS